MTSAQEYQLYQCPKKITSCALNLLYCCCCYLNSLKYMNNELAIKEWAIKSSAISQNLVNLSFSLSLLFLFRIYCSLHHHHLFCFVFNVLALDKRSPYKRSWTTNCLFIPHQKTNPENKNWSQNFLFFSYFILLFKFKAIFFFLFFIIFILYFYRTQEKTQ